jgi:hypothetical protein
MDIQQEKSLKLHRVILGSLTLVAIAFSGLWPMFAWRSKASSWKLLAETIILLAFVIAILVLDTISWHKVGKSHYNSAQDPSSAKDLSSAQDPRSAQHLQCFLHAFAPLFDVCTPYFESVWLIESS